jgi:peptide/nickel transport system substrate-binding protein
MKKFVRLVALLLALVFVLAACGSSSQSPASEESAAPVESTAADTQTESNAMEETVVAAQDVIANDGTLTVGWTTGVEGFDPVSDNNYIGNYLVYEGLFNMNPDTQELENVLCESYEWVDDCTLKIKLKDNVYFSDGDKLVAEDVLYSMYRYIELGSNLSTYYTVYDWDKCVAEDDLNLTLVTFEPYGPGLSNLTRPVLNKSWCESAAEEDWWDKPCGTGPYTVAENISGSHTTYTLRDDYWNADNSSFDFSTMTVRSYAESSTMFIDFENGAIDVAFGISVSDATRVLNGEVDCGYVVRSNNDVINLVFNEACPYFEDLRVRQAIAYAIDREAVGKAAYGDLTIPATSFVSASLGQYYENVGAFDYDPEKAKELLAEAGYADGFDVKMVIVNSTANQTLAEAVQFYLGEVGINMTIESYAIPTAVPMFMAGEADLVLNQQNGGAYLLEPNQVYDTSGENSTNLCVRCTDAEFNSYLQNGLHSVDVAVRAENYKNAQKWNQENVHTVPLVEDTGCYVFSGKVQSFSVNSLTYPNLLYIKAAQ